MVRLPLAYAQVEGAGEIVAEKSVFDALQAQGDQAASLLFPALPLFFVSVFLAGFASEADSVFPSGFASALGVSALSVDFPFGEA